MNDRSKSKDDLIRELLGLQKEHESLKALFDKNITGQKRAELDRDHQLLFAKALKEIAEVVIFNDKAEEILDLTNRIIAETLQLDRALIYDVSFEKNCLTGLCEWLKQGHPDIAETKSEYPIDMFLVPLTEIRNTHQYLESHSNEIGEFFQKDESGKILHNQFNIKSLIWFPFAFDRHGYHIFTLNQILEHRQWRQEEVDFLGSVARNVSLALMKIKLLEERAEAERELMESEERFRHIASTISDISYSCERDKDGSYSIVWITGAVLQITGYTNEEIKAIKCWGKLVVPEDIDSFNQNVKNLSPGSTRKCELRLKQKNGSVVWVESFAECLKPEHQTELIKLYGALVDVTDRKKSEEALRKIEAKYSSLFENVQDVFYQIDLNGIILEISPSIKYFSEFKSEEVLGTNVADLYYNPQDRAIFLEAIKNNGEIRDYELFLKTKSGGKRVVSLNARLIFDAEGKPNHIDGALRDITERKLAEEELREKDVQFRKLSSNLPDLIYQFTRKPDGTYCVPIASDGIMNIFGCSPEDVIDDFSPIVRVIFPEDWERVMSEIEYSAKHLTYFTCEFRVQIPGKPIQWMFSRSTPEKLADGSITWYGFNANITGMKQTEMYLIKAKERAEESDRLKSAFLANMSHEIRTPMNGILGFANLLQEPNLTGQEQQEYIRIIQKSGKRMLNIIHDIVDISKIEAGQMEVSISETNINEQIEFIYDFFKLEIEKKGLQFLYKTALPLKEALIHTDREKIYAILTNLVKNSIKYTSAGSIEIGYAKKGKFLEFFVKDSGMGISKDRQEAIFERFIQADISNKRAYDGAGLGLSIAKGYVEMLGWKIRVESQERQGSTFYFTIPCNGDHEEIRGVKNIVSAGLAESQIKILKILIAEDDETSEMLMRMELELFGKEILSVGTGTEAVETCRNNPDIDLIMMDIRMPEMNGYEATRQIRQFNNEVIIIAQTAFGLSGDREKALEAGCSDYLSKPIVLDELLGLLKKYFK